MPSQEPSVTWDPREGRSLWLGNSSQLPGEDPARGLGERRTTSGSKQVEARKRDGDLVSEESWAVGWVEVGLPKLGVTGTSLSLESQVTLGERCPHINTHTLTHTHSHHIFFTHQLMDTWVVSISCRPDHIK